MDLCINTEYSLSVSPLLVSKIIVNNNPIIIDKIEKSCAIKPDRAQLGLQELVRFLDLIFTSKKSLTPSLSVDLIWHEFILFTRVYVAFCEQRYGRYIHHNPDSSTKKNQTRFNLTLQFYHSTYGEPNPEFWEHEISSNKHQCGSCDSRHPQQKLPDII